MSLRSKNTMLTGKKHVCQTKQKYIISVKMNKCNRKLTTESLPSPVDRYSVSVTLLYVGCHRSTEAGTVSSELTQTRFLFTRRNEWLRVDGCVTRREVTLIHHTTSYQIRRESVKAWKEKNLART